jgi:hypothetical protein
MYVVIVLLAWCQDIPTHVACSSEAQKAAGLLSDVPTQCIQWGEYRPVVKVSTCDNPSPKKLSYVLIDTHPVSTSLRICSDSQVNQPGEGFQGLQNRTVPTVATQPDVCKLKVSELLQLHQ